MRRVTPGYVPYAEKFGVWQRGWGPMKPRLKKFGSLISTARALEMKRLPNSSNGPPSTHRKNRQIRTSRVRMSVVRLMEITNQYQVAGRRAASAGEPFAIG